MTTSGKFDYQTARLYDTDEVCRWRSVATFPSISMIIGRDEEGSWVQFVEQTKVVIRAERHRMLYFFRLLDLEYADVSFSFRQVAEELVEGSSEARFDELVDMLVEDALGSRTTAYVSRAVHWCDSISLSIAVRAALLELTRSKRGTQSDRQAAFRLLKRQSGDGR